MNRTTVSQFVAGAFAASASLMAFMALMAGCSTPSLAPFVSEEAACKEPRLTGQWTFVDEAPAQGGAKAVFRIEEAECGYTLTGSNMEKLKVNDIEPVDRLLVQPFRIDGALFADLSLTPDDRRVVCSKYLGFVIPAHQVARLDMEGDTLAISLVDREWLHEYLKQPERPSHYAEAQIAMAGSDVLIDGKRLIDRGVEDVLTDDDSANLQQALRDAQREGKLTMLLKLKRVSPTGAGAESTKK